MEKYKGTCNIFICLGIGILMAAIVFAYFYTREKNKPTEAICQPGPAAESPAPCAAGDVSASVVFDAGAGNIYGALSIKNTSAKTCTIAGNNFPQLNYDQAAVKNINVINQGLPSVKQYAIAPGSAVYARVHFPNGPQCGSAINTFDQADTGNAIMDKPGGQELRSCIEKLREALNQQGKVTILSGKAIEQILADRQKYSHY